jgi:hypothetical protein
VPVSGFPFVQFSDGSLLMLRLKYPVQRMFGDVLYLKVYDALRGQRSQRANRFKSARNSIFEYPGSGVCWAVSPNSNAPASPE